MPKTTIIEVEEAPPIPSRGMGKVYTLLVTQVPEGKVGRVELEGDETIRGVHGMLTRASKKVGVKLQIWHDEGMIYFRRMPAKES